MARRGHAALAFGVLSVALAACGESGATAKPEVRATASAAASGAAAAATATPELDPKGEDSGW